LCYALQTAPKFSGVAFILQQRVVLCNRISAFCMFVGYFAPAGAGLSGANSAKAKVKGKGKAAAKRHELLRGGEFSYTPDAHKTP
jgi:hypothetical protein